MTGMSLVGARPTTSGAPVAQLERLRTVGADQLEGASPDNMGRRARPSAIRVRCRAGCAPNLSDRRQQRPRLVLMLEELALGHRVVHDAGRRLHRRDAVGDDARPNRDREVHSLDAGADVADRAAVRSAALRLHLVDDLHRAHLRRAGERAGGEAGAERVHRGESVAQLAVHLADEMQHVRVALDDHELAHLHRAVLRDAADVVPAEVDEHQMLGALLLVGDAARRSSRRRLRRVRPRRRVPAIGRSVTVPLALTRTSSSGELPTISTPSSTRWYMYGDGLITRSAR